MKLVKRYFEIFLYLLLLCLQLIQPQIIIFLFFLFFVFFIVMRLV